MEDIITDIPSLLCLLPYPVSRKNLSLLDCIRKTHLQHTKNEQRNVALGACYAGTFLPLCSALLQNKVPLSPGLTDHVPSTEEQV